MPQAICAEEAERVLARYAIGRVQRLAPGGGTANANARVDAERGTYFLKRRNPKYADPGFVAFDHALMEHLAPHRIGTPLAERADDGARWVCDSGQVYELYPFQSGAPHDPRSLPQIRAAGRALAEYHRASRTFPAPPGKAWPRYQDPRRIREGLTELGDTLAPFLGDVDLGTLWSQVSDLERAIPDSVYDSLPRVVVHGDYHPGNVLFDHNRVCGLFDLDWATVQPRALDLADGLFLWSGERAHPIDAADIVSLTQTWTPSPPRWQAFVAGYLELEAIAPAEWDALVPLVRARWLYCRIAGRLKVPAERQAAFVADGLLAPLRVLDAIPADAWNPA